MIEKIIDELKIEIGEENFNNYLKITKIKEMENQIVFKAPNLFIAKIIQTKFEEIIKKTVKKFYENYSVKICTINQNFSRPKDDAFIKNINKQISVLNQSLTFDNFIVGESNELAYKACKDISNIKNFGCKYNPIFIYSNTGLGKTHLLQASAHECLAIEKNVLYKTSQAFKKDYQNAVITNKFANFDNEYKNCELLLIDDIQFLSNAEKMQEEFFEIFNNIIQKNGQIIMTSDVAPKNLNGITERLRNRFSNGLIINITVPDINTKKEIIKKKSEINDIYLDDEMINIIANYIGENIRDLESIISNIRALNQFTGQKITLEIVKSQIQEYIRDKQSNIEIEDIFDVISEHFNIKISDIKSNSKKKEIVKAKRIVIFLTKELMSNSISKIASHFQMKDHSAVSKHIKKINEIIINNDDFRLEVESLKNKVISSKNINKS